MKSYTEIIDKYLNNELIDTERNEFEEALKNNKELKQQLEIQKELIKSVQYLGLKREVQQAYNKAKRTKAIK